jgi:hypothetical protein|tara:strand:+ start:2929 stop:3279 length:351 start_codon:yes stop_codon:yes gene_type:complete
MGNRLATELFYDTDFSNSITKLIHRFYRDYKYDFELISLFDQEDVEQEVWAHLLEQEKLKKRHEVYERAKSYLRELLRIVKCRGEITEIISFSDFGFESQEELDNYLYEHEAKIIS